MLFISSEWELFFYVCWLRRIFYNIVIKAITVSLYKNLDINICNWQLLKGEKNTKYVYRDSQEFLLYAEQREKAKNYTVLIMQGHQLPDLEPQLWNTSVKTFFSKMKHSRITKVISSSVESQAQEDWEPCIWFSTEWKHLPGRIFFRDKKNCHMQSEIGLLNWEL